MTNQPFHLVTPSPWPLLTSIRLINNFISVIRWFYNYSLISYLSIPCTMICSILWWRDITRESTHQGFHTTMVLTIIRTGIILFIISEIIFFLSFFWSYFHRSLSPPTEIGQLWPPKGIRPFNPYDIPLLNSVILITSGISITWSHHCIIYESLGEAKKSLLFTISLGIYFTSLQIIEYKQASFSIADSIYGSTFFITTGFHGIHVIIGTIFIFVTIIRLCYNQFSKTHHFGFEAAAWYWHFVDVIWLFLFISVYWWRY